MVAQIIKNDGDSCIAEEVIAKIDTEGQEATSGAMQIQSVPDAEPAPGAKPGVPAEVAAALRGGLPAVVAERDGSQRGQAQRERDQG